MRELACRADVCGGRSPNGRLGKTQSQVRALCLLRNVQFAHLPLREIAIMNSPAKLSPRRSMTLCGALLLLLFATSAQAASLPSEPGFWAGAADGLLALLKLLISPIASVSIVDPAAVAWQYDAGYYLGVLTFAAAAGMAASAPVVDPAKVAPQPPRGLSAARRP